MGAYRPSKTDRKKLKVKRELLFTMFDLRYGTPSSAVTGFMIIKGGFTISGVHAWIKETAEGREFAELVAGCGDAKRRAGYWYKQWVKEHAERKKTASGGASKV